MKTWRAYLTHDEMTAITSEDIKKNPRHYGHYFKDVNNPTDEEVQKYFEKTFPDMSDPWEIPANGKLRIEIIDTDKEECIPKVGDGIEEDYCEILTRLEANKLQVWIDGKMYTIEAAAPIHVTLNPNQ